MNNFCKHADSVQEVTTAKREKSLIKDAIQLLHDKLDSFPEYAILCSDAYNEIYWEQFDDDLSGTLAHKLSDNYKMSFQAIQELLEDDLITDEFKVAEGTILLRGRNELIQHCWLIDPATDSIIDPIMVRLGKQTEDIRYYLGVTISITELGDLVKWPEISNTPYSELLNNEYNCYSGRMYGALENASEDLLTETYQVDFIEDEEIGDKLNLWDYTKGLHELE